MKTLISNYQFNAAQKKITFSDYTTIDLERILLITNVTNNVIIYNFADSSLGGTVNQNILTLTYDVTSMSNTDKLQIFYDSIDGAATDAVLQELRENTILLRRFLKAQEGLMQLCGTTFGTYNSSPYRINVMADVPQLSLPQSWQYSDLARIASATAIRANLSFS